MSDGTKTTEGVWPEPADLSDQQTIASEPHGDPATAEYPPFAGDDTSPELAGSGAEEDGEDEWPVRTPAKGIRLGIPAALMLAVVLVALGFWGGAIAQKNHATASAGNGAAAFAARLRNAASGATGATGTSGAGGFRFPGGAGATSGSDATTGTISVVDGKTVYILTATNQLVKVTLTPATTVTRNAKAGATQLRPGDTVVVQGATGKGGDVQASSVAATAKGVSSTAGGFPGGFAGGGFTPGGAGQGTPGG